jgi:hypothetical protein
MSQHAKHLGAMYQIWKCCRNQILVHKKSFRGRLDVMKEYFVSLSLYVLIGQWRLAFPVWKVGRVFASTPKLPRLVVTLKNTRLASHSWKKTFYIEASKEKPDPTNVHGQLSTSIQGITNCSQMWSCWEQCQMWLSLSLSPDLSHIPLLAIEGFSSFDFGGWLMENPC